MALLTHPLQKSSLLQAPEPCQVLPALKDKTDVPLMKELLHRHRMLWVGSGGFDWHTEDSDRWINHKLYVKWMDRFFTYLVRPLPFRIRKCCNHGECQDLAVMLHAP